MPLGYLSSGLWRSVLAVDPRQPMTTPVVLKMMKQEHDVDSRNFDRHRRDGLVMERLTSSPNVVDIYGFCGNTVLTEFIETPLDELIEGSKTSPGISMDSPRDRIRLARDMASGLAALHDIPGGPILHADVTARQFLVSPSGTLKVNDFNRCRFMANNTLTGGNCPVRIPSAPGKARSPEEYSGSDLTEKADVYSLANVLYELLAGENPWDHVRANEAKKMIMKGVIPNLPAEFRKPGTTDVELALLMMRAYQLHPAERISAAELVKELDLLLERVVK